MQGRGTVPETRKSRQSFLQSENDAHGLLYIRGLVHFDYIPAKLDGQLGVCVIKSVKYFAVITKIVNYFKVSQFTRGLRKLGERYRVQTGQSK